MNADEVRRDWAGRTTEFSPGYYAYYGPNETSEVVRRTLDRLVDTDAPVLELGCSSGRHLAHLREHGYDDLHGVDINDEAFDVMAESYPGLADDGTFYHGAIEDVVGEFDDARFGAVYSVETLQHIHDDAAWVFEELARIAGDALITVECESPGDGSATTGGPAGASPAVTFVNGDIPLYYRAWDRIFGRFGLVEVATRSLDGNTLRAFRQP